MTSVIDLSQVPSPDVVDPIDYETTLASLKQLLINAMPSGQQASITAILEIESSPLTSTLEAIAYLATNLQQRINEAAQAVMLPYARGSDLDNLATLFGVQRLVVTPADPDANPPTAAIYEADTALRRRVQLSLDGLSVAGPAAAYVYHALSAAGGVLDASASSPSPGDVLVTVLGRDGDGTASAELLAAVNSAVSAENVRPLTDHVSVQSVDIVNYSVEATIYVYDGPDSSVVLANAHAAMEKFAAAQHRIGHEIALSGIYAALHQGGVQRVELKQPTADIDVDETQAAYCPAGNITLTFGGVAE